jgi:hypothetical protein
MMDEKKVREAIEYLQRQICTLDVQKEYDEYGRPLYNETLDMAIKLYETAIEALEKQLPKKGIKEKITEGVNKGLHKYYCPIYYEKGDLSNKCNVGDYCSDCGQRLDWSE